MQKLAADEVSFINQIVETQTGMKEAELWRKIRLMAKTNVTLQAALDDVIVIYNLSKPIEQPKAENPQSKVDDIKRKIARGV